MLLIFLLLRGKPEARRSRYLIGVCFFNLALFAGYKLSLSMDAAYIRAYYPNGFSIFNELPLHLCNINLFEMPTSVEILNHRWEQNRIKAWKEVFEHGIRNRETRITVDVPSTYDPGFTPVSSEKDFISWGANNAFYEGNIVDGMEAGKDFRKVKSGFSTDTSGEVKSFFVEVEYLDAQS